MKAASQGQLFCFVINQSPPELVEGGFDDIIANAAKRSVAISSYLVPMAIGSRRRL
jgi:hypothetical protein